MATAPFPTSFSSPTIYTASPPDDLRPARRPSVRRRGNYEQGRALEMLGHAIEYLADSGLFAESSTVESMQAEAQAVQILMRASRAVFEECAEVVPVGERLSRWFDRRVLGLRW